ncbi:unnamed protein product [Rhodiola kirilowii]
MEGMVTDLTLARENQVSFEDYINNNSDANPGIDFDCNSPNNWLLAKLQVL